MQRYLTFLVLILFASLTALLTPVSLLAQEASEISADQNVTAKEKSIKKKSSKKKPKKKRDSSGREGVVKVDGAAIYEAPSFDSPVMEYLDRGKKVRISKKLYPGMGIGAFYKIKVRTETYGYITDTDVAVGPSAASAPPPEEVTGSSSENPQETGPFIDEKEMMAEEGEEEGDSNILKSYFGPALYSISYAEKIMKKKEASNTMMLGLKSSGSTKYLGGMPLDVNFLFTTSAPDFYDEISRSTSGFMLMADALVMLPIVDKKTYYMFYGFGFVTRYSKWTVKLKNQASGAPELDSQELAIGGAMTVGAAFNLGPRMVFHVDGRYYLEQEFYPGFGAALEFKY